MVVTKTLNIRIQRGRRKLGTKSGWLVSFSSLPGVFVHSFIHSFTKYLLSSDLMPGPALDGETAVRRMTKSLPSWGWHDHTASR